MKLPFRIIILGILQNFFLGFRTTAGDFHAGYSPLQYGWRFTPFRQPVQGAEYGDLSLPYRSGREALEGKMGDDEKVSVGHGRKRDASYWSSFYSSNQYKCDFTCEDGTCLLNEQRCNNYAECWDGTDEKGCLCKDLIAIDRICDGYKDCPDGLDEHDCVYGCQANEFTCDVKNTGSKVKCISMSKRCDGYSDCPLKNDEHDCYRMVDLHEDGYQSRGYRSSGILQKRVGNYWHTICKTAGTTQHIQSYAEKACQHSSGYINGPIGITTVSLSQLKQKMTLQQSRELKYVKMAEIEAEFAVLGACASDYAYKIECPSPQCGGLGNKEQKKAKRSVDNEFYSFGMEDDDTEFDFGEEEDNDQEINPELIVGGSATGEMSWPFLVGIFRDGEFFCGGSIINDRWIMTAAHCSHGYDKHTYEVQAGMTRRYSWGPYEQTRHVEDIYVHEDYDSKVFANDIALYKLDRPLYLSKYVTPACLPEGLEDDPKGGQKCKVAGWGDLSESGSGPDHMQEVTLPILAKCQETFTKDAYQICAGFAEGGKDACQGDSGGPLMCENSAGRPTVNGVVSFGRGCARANEAGAYTRVSAYLDWIQSIVNGENSHPSYYPRPKQCIERCHKAGGECMYPEEKCSGKVECLDAKDEMGCTHLVTRAHQNQYYPMNKWSGGYSQSQSPQKAYQGIGISRSASGATNTPVVTYPYSYPYLATYGTPQYYPIGYRTAKDVNQEPGIQITSRKTVTDCGRNEIRCATARTSGINECIALNKFCDGTSQCNDFSDEMKCVSLTMDFSGVLSPTVVKTEDEIKGFIIARVGSEKWHLVVNNEWSLSQGQAICDRVKSDTTSTAILESMENIDIRELAKRTSSTENVLAEGRKIIQADSKSRIVFVPGQTDTQQGARGHGLVLRDLHETLKEANTNENSNGVMVGFVRCTLHK